MQTINDAVCFSCLEKLDQKRVNVDIGNYHAACSMAVFGSQTPPKLLLKKSEIYSPATFEKSQRSMSISGVQTKISLQFSHARDQLVPSGTDASFLLKPSPDGYEQCSEGELLGLVSAKLGGMECPPGALVRLLDGHLSYLIRRFDRDLYGNKTHRVEDMTQIMNIERDEKGIFKYGSSYEEAIQNARVATGNKLSTSAELLKRLVHTYLFANGDYHLKNISLVARKEESGHLLSAVSPVYDVVPTSIWLTREKPLALCLLKEEAEGRFSERYEALGFHSRFDFLELAKRLEIGQKYALQVFTRQIEVARKTILIARDAQLFSEERFEIFQHEVCDRVKKIQT